MASPRRTRQMFQPSTPPSKARNESANVHQQTPTDEQDDTTHESAHPYGDNTYDYTALTNQTGTSFSPSKARAQAKVTHQTAILKRWLANLISPQERGTISSNPIAATTLPRQASDQQHEHTHTHPLITRWEAEYTALKQLPPSQYPSISDEILKALQDLMYANQAANSHRMLIHEARQEELARLKATDTTITTGSNNDIAKSLLADLEKTLPHQAQTSLASLSELAVLLGTIPSPEGPTHTSKAATTQTRHAYPSLSPSMSLLDELSGPLIEQTSRILELRRTILDLEQVKATLERQLVSARGELTALEKVKDRSDRSAELMQAQTTQWQREAKQIALKIQEYNDRIATLIRTRPGMIGDDAVLVEDVVALQQRNQDRRKVVEALEERVRLFNGLPADLDASREEVKRARLELAGLKKRREELFEGMAS